MTSLARYEFVSLIEEPEADSGFAELEPPPRVWTEEEVRAIRAEADAAGRAGALAEAKASNEARAADAAEALAKGIEALAADIARIRADIAHDAAMLARGIALKLANEALHNDPLSVVEPIIEGALSELVGPHRLEISVHDILKPVVESRTRDLAERLGFEGGIRVRGGEDELTDCRIEWGSGGVQRDVREMMTRIDRHFAAHGFAPEPGEETALDDAAEGDGGSAFGPGENPTAGD